MDTLHGIPWILVDKNYGFHGLIPWNYHQKLELSWNPYGIRTECPRTKKWNLAGHVTQSAYPKNFRILSTDIPWNPAESMESTEFRRKRWGTVKYSAILAAKWSPVCTLVTLHVD